MTRVAAPAEHEPPRAQRRRGPGGPAGRHLVRPRVPRVPEPREILDSPGHPLDPGVRREMETRLGHDFSQVLIHADRDSAALAGLLGADAVTVGREVFFAANAYQPWSAEGRRLLAHELLHTVQAPHAPGALRAGRDVGALSLPHEPLEREATGEAQRSGGDAAPATADREPELSAQAATAAHWLRYATVTAEQQRIEQLDPATLVDRLVAGVLRSLRGDPVDSSKRIQLQLARLGEELRSSVLDKLEVRLPTADHRQVAEAAAELDENAAPLPVDPAPAPESVPVPDPQGEQSGRDEARDSDSEQARQRDQDAAPQEAQARKEQDEAAAQAAEQTAESGEQRKDETKAAEQDKAGTEAAAADAAQKTAQDEQRQAEQAGQQQKQAAETESAEKGKASATGEKERAERAGATGEAGRPGGPGATPQGPMPGAQPIAAAPAGAEGGAPPADLDRIDAIAEEPGGPLGRHKLTAKPGKTDEQQPSEVPPGEQPEGLDADAAGPVTETEGFTPNLPELPPQQPIPSSSYLPKQDMDVSGVPTAAQIALPTSGAPPPPPGAPSFPAPPEPEMRAERPDEPDPVEKRLEEQDRREGGRIEVAAGQVGPDAAEQEPDAAPGPGPEPAAGAAPGPATATGGAGAVAGPEAGIAAGTAAGPEAAGAGSTAGGTAVPGEAAADVAGAPGPEGGPGGAAPGAAGAVPEDASLEAGGGACAEAPEPAPAPEQGGGPCGSGGPGAAPEQPQPAAPDVSQQEPQAALATAGQLPATQMLASLDGVGTAATRSAGQERDQLAGSPPQLERPSGAPQTWHGAPREASPASYTPDKVEKVTAAGKGEQKEPESKTVTGGPTPADQVPAPKITGDESGKTTDADVQHIQEAVGSVPTTDPVLDHASVGTAPTVELSGETDPALSDQQQARLHDKSMAILATGREDAAKPLGENQIYPDVPHEILTAQVPAAQPSSPAGPASAAIGPAAGGAGAGATGGPNAAGDQAVSAIAQQERGPQLQAAVGQGQSQMAAGQESKQQDEQRAQDEHRAQLEIAIKEHADQETAERAKARELAHGQRTAWQQEQAKLVSDAGTEAGQKHDKARSDITEQKAGTDRKVADRQRDDNGAIEAQRRKAEKDARAERDKKKDSDGWFGKIVSAIKDAFNALVSAIKGIFDAARAFVQGVIDKFKSFVTGLIDLARKAIAGLIKALADVLIKIGDTLLAAFPTLRDKFRKMIEDLRDASIRTVNKIADALKSAVTKLLDLFAKALTALLDLYEKALMAAVAYVRDVVTGVIDFVKSAIAALADFAAIVADVAADPIGWLKKLGAAVVDGIRNCLWGAIKNAVRQWFNEKVQAIIGLGQLIIKVLIKGCFSVAKIARMAWDALIKSLPAMLIQILVERLISLIVPAAGAIMAIVQGAIAAYQSIGKIIAAISKFVAFLKGVRSGQGARLFAEGLAAGVVALIEFVSNFLMSKLGNAAKGVGTKLKGIADRILKFLARGAKAVRKGVGVVVNTAKRVAKAAAGLAKKVFKGVARAGRGGMQTLGRMAKGAVHALGRGARALGSRLAKTKVGKALISTASKLKAMYQKAKAKLIEWREKFKKWREDRKKNKPTPEQRLEAAVERIRPKAQWLLDRGIPRPILNITLKGLKFWYRLADLSITGRPASGIRAALNPEEDSNQTDEVIEDEILRMVREMVESDLASQEAQEQAAQVTATPQDPGEVAPEAFLTRGSASTIQKPARVSQISIPSGVPPRRAAAGLRQVISMGRVGRIRVIRLGGEKGIVFASVRTTGSDPIGVLRQLRRNESGIYVPVDVPHTYAKQAQLAAQAGKEVSAGLQALRQGDYEAVAEMPHAELVAQTGTQLMLAEPGRAPYAHATAEAAGELVQAAGHGERAGVPLSEILAKGPYTKSGSVSATGAMMRREMRTAEQRAAGEQPFHWRRGPHTETVQGLVQRIMAILTALAVAKGVMTAAGAKEVELEKLRDAVRKLLSSPAIRGMMFRGPR